MQVLERTEEDRDKRAAQRRRQRGTRIRRKKPSMAPAQALEIRASHITAAAVAAAAVPQRPVAGWQCRGLQDQVTQEAPAVAVQEEPAPATRRGPRGPRTEPEVQASTRGALLVSLLTLAIIGLAMWLGAQWPQRALKPVMQQLPSLSKPAAADPVVPVASQETAEPSASDLAPGPT
jgi:hypothetical protein